MASLKENIEIQSGGAVLATQEGAYRIKQWYLNLPRWEKGLIIALAILAIPGYFGVRYGTELIMTKQLARESLVAQPSFTDPEPLQVTKATIVENSTGTYSAYVTVTNPNLDLGLPQMSFTFKFFNQAGEQVATYDGDSYILPDEQKLVLAPRVLSEEEISSATFAVDTPTWQKRLSLIDVELRMSEPYVYEELSPLGTSAEGSVVNNSEFNIKQATLVLVLYGPNNKILAVTQREEFSLKPFERRAYKLTWPGIIRGQVTKIDLKAYTNVLDESNLTVGSNR